MKKSSGVSFNNSSRTSVPRTLGASTASATCGSFNSISPPPATPAVCITPSILPKRSRAWANTSRMRFMSVTSALSIKTSAPSASSASTSFIFQTCFVFRIVSREPLCPLFSGRKCGAPDEHQLRVRLLREIFGEGQTKSAQSARDEVDAAFSQPPISLFRLVQLDLFKHLRPTMTAAIGHDRLRPVRACFSRATARPVLFLRICALRKRNINRATINVVIFLRDHFAES